MDVQVDEMEVDGQIDAMPLPRYSLNYPPASAPTDPAVAVPGPSNTTAATTSTTTKAPAAPVAGPSLGAMLDGVLASVGVPCTGAPVLAHNTIVPSVTVSLHPLVILHLSEHWTRIRAQEGQKQQVIGALIGKQKGRNIEVMNAFELRFDTVDGDIIINQEYYATKEQQCEWPDGVHKAHTRLHLIFVFLHTKFPSYVSQTLLFYSVGFSTDCRKC